MKDLGRVVKRKFYKDAAHLSADQIAVMCKRNLSLTNKARVGWHRNGEFLPLDVWASKGFDKVAIEAGARPEDFHTDEQFGWVVYRVPIYSEHQGHDQETADKVDLGGQARRTKALKRARELPGPMMVPISHEHDTDSEQTGFSESFGNDEDSDLDDESVASSHNRKRKAPKTTKVAVAEKPKKLSKEEQKAAREEKKKAEQAKREDKKQATAQLKKVSTLVI